MVAARVLSGAAREAWTEAVPHAGGGVLNPRVITTGIKVRRLSDASRFRGSLYSDNVIGNPNFQCAVSINAQNFLVVTVTNTGGIGDTATYTLECELLPTLSQANDLTLAAPSYGGFVVVLAPRRFGLSYLNRTVRAVVAVDAILATDDTLEVTDPGGVGYILTLPLIATVPVGRRYTIKRLDVGAGVIVLAGNGALIDGGAQFNIVAQYESLTVESDGAAWNIVEVRLVPAAAHAATHGNGQADPTLDAIRTPAAGAFNFIVTDKHVRADSGGAGVAATLYVADAAAVGRVITCIKIDAAAFAVTVTPFAGDTINGGAGGVALAAQWDSVTLRCVAVGEWEVIALTP